jgi:hypothetical protein
MELSPPTRSQGPFIRAHFGDGAATQFSIRHGLATKDVAVRAFELFNNQNALTGWRVLDPDTVQLDFAVAPKPGFGCVAVQG